MKSYFEAILDLIVLFLFGERNLSGSPMNMEKGKPTGSFKTVYPPEPVSENEWMKMFRVSSLHKVDQRVFFESR